MTLHNVIIVKTDTPSFKGHQLNKIKAHQMNTEFYLLNIV